MTSTSTSTSTNTSSLVCAPRVVLPPDLNAVPFFARQVQNVMAFTANRFHRRPGAVVLADPFSVAYLACTPGDPFAIAACFRFPPVFTVHISSAEWDVFSREMAAAARCSVSIVSHWVVDLLDADAQPFVQFVHMGTDMRPVHSTFMQLGAASDAPCTQVSHVPFKEVSTQLRGMLLGSAQLRDAFAPVWMALSRSTNPTSTLFHEVASVFAAPPPPLPLPVQLPLPPPPPPVLVSTSAAALLDVSAAPWTPPAGSTGDKAPTPTPTPTRHAGKPKTARRWLATVRDVAKWVYIASRIPSLSDAANRLIEKTSRQLVFGVVPSDETMSEVRHDVSVLADSQKPFTSELARRIIQKTRALLDAFPGAVPK
jgi:hypothetical protein